MLLVFSCGLAGAESGRERGAALFQQKGCAHCHAINGAGGHKGPDLSAVGTRLKPAAIQRQIVSGGLAMPAFGEALSPGETKDLVSFLHTCRKNLAPAGVPQL